MKLAGWKQATAVVAFLAIFGTAVGIGMTSTTPERMTTASGRIDPSDLSISAIDADVKGKNRVDVTVTLANGAAVPRAANMTIQLLDSAGSVLAERAVATPAIAAGASWSRTESVTQAGIVAAYVETFVIVEE